MNPAQSKALKTELLKVTDRHGASAVAWLYKPGLINRMALVLVERHARHSIEDAAKSGGIALDMAAVDAAPDGAVLPPGWFQALITALPQILAFVMAISKIFGLG